MVNKDLLNKVDSPSGDDFSSKLSALKSFKKEDTKQKATLNKHLEEILNELKSHALWWVDESIIINIVHERLEEKVWKNTTRLQDKIEHAVWKKLQEQWNTVKQYAYISNYEQLINVEWDGSMANPYIITKGKNFYRKMPEELSSLLLSSDTANALSVWTDKRLYVSSEAKEVKYDHGIYKTVQEALDKSFEHWGSVIVNNQYNNWIQVVKWKLGLWWTLETDTEILLDKNDLIFETSKRNQISINDDCSITVWDETLWTTVDKKAIKHSSWSSINFWKNIQYKADTHTFEGKTVFEGILLKTLTAKKINTQWIILKWEEWLLGLNSKWEVITTTLPIQVEWWDLVSSPIVNFVGWGKAVRTRQEEDGWTITTHTEIYAGATLYVDDIYWDDDTAKRERRDKPFQTIDKAIQASKEWDTIEVIHYEWAMHWEVNHNLTIKGDGIFTDGELIVKECELHYNFYTSWVTINTTQATVHMKWKTITMEMKPFIYSHGKNKIYINVNRISSQNCIGIDLWESIWDTIMVHCSTRSIEWSSHLIWQSKLAKWESYLHNITINSDNINHNSESEKGELITLDISDTILKLNAENIFAPNVCIFNIEGGNNQIYIHSRNVRARKLIVTDSHWDDINVIIHKWFFLDWCIDILYGAWLIIEWSNIDVDGWPIIDATESTININQSDLFRKSEKGEWILLQDSVITFKWHNFLVNKNKQWDDIIKQSKSSCNIYWMVYTNPEMFGFDVDNVSPSLID